MVNFVILAVLVFLVLLLVLLFLKAKTMQHKTYAILITVMLIFFYVTGSKIIAENNVDLKTFDGMVTAGKLYFSWLGHVLQNTKVLIGNAVKMDWRGNITLEK